MNKPMPIAEIKKHLLGKMLAVVHAGKTKAGKLLDVNKNSIKLRLKDGRVITRKPEHIVGMFKDDDGGIPERPPAWRAGSVGSSTEP